MNAANDKQKYGEILESFYKNLNFSETIHAILVKKNTVNTINFLIIFYSLKAFAILVFIGLSKRFPLFFFNLFTVPYGVSGIKSSRKYQTYTIHNNYTIHISLRFI